MQQVTPQRKPPNNALQALTKPSRFDHAGLDITAGDGVADSIQHKAPVLCRLRFATCERCDIGDAVIARPFPERFVR
jgi:hypothetical protein